MLLAPYWARKSDHHGRKALTLIGVGGFIVSMTLCGLALLAGLKGVHRRSLTFGAFAIFRAIYGGLGCATPCATQAYLASQTRRSGRVEALSALSHASALAPSSARRWRPCSCCRSSGWRARCSSSRRSRIVVFVAILLWLPDDSKPRSAPGHGAAMSYPSLASAPTGASVIAATSPRAARLKWNDARIRTWIIAGVVAGHAQAATLACIGFFVIDRLHLAPHGSEGSRSRSS